MKVLVDADACPVRDIIYEESFKRRIPVVMVVSMSQGIGARAGMEIVRVDQEFQAADIAIVNRCGEGDIVVTSDYGLAALVLGKGAQAVSPSGKLFKSHQMDQLLEKRHLAGKIRRGGGKVRGPRARLKEDDSRFRESMIQLLEQSPPLRIHESQEP